MNRKKLIRGSEASFRQKDGSNLTDLKKLAKVYSSWGNIPKKLEISVRWEYLYWLRPTLAVRGLNDFQRCR